MLLRGTVQISGMPVSPVPFLQVGRGLAVVVESPVGPSGGVILGGILHDPRSLLAGKPGDPNVLKSQETNSIEFHLKGCISVKNHRLLDFRKLGSALLTEKIALPKLHLSTRSAQVQSKK